MIGLFVIAWRYEGDAEEEWHPHAIYVCDCCADRDFHRIVNSDETPYDVEFILFDAERIERINRSTGALRKERRPPYTLLQ